MTSPKSPFSRRNFLSATTAVAAVAGLAACVPSNAKVEPTNATLGPLSTASPGPDLVAITVAAVQAEPVWFDLEGTTEKTIALMGDAAENGAHLLAFPETWLPGYPTFMWFGDESYQKPFRERYVENSMIFGSEQHRKIEKAAADLGIHVVLGLSERDGDDIYMGMWVIDDKGTTTLRRRKARPSGKEWDIFRSGQADDYMVVDSAVGRIGALSCNENRRPLVRHSLYSQNEQIHVAAWPHFGLYPDVHPMSAETSMESSAQYAAEGSVLTLAPTITATAPFLELLNIPAADKDRLLLGHGSTRIFNPAGESIATAIPPEAEGIVYATVARDMVVRERVYDTEPLKVQPDGRP